MMVDENTNITINRHNRYMRSHLFKRYRGSRRSPSPVMDSQDTQEAYFQTALHCGRTVVQRTLSRHSLQRV
jgi:hypothetical protein